MNDDNMQDNLEMNDIEFEDTPADAQPQPAPQPAPQPTFTYEQVENLLRLASQRQAAAPVTPTVDPLEEKLKQKAELYGRLQQGDAEALVQYMQVAEEVATLKAERTAVQAAQQQTAGQVAMMNVRQVLDELRAQEAKTPTGFGRLEAAWYQRMVQQAQQNPSLFTNLEAARQAGEMLLGQMYLQTVRQSPRKAPPPNPARDAAGKFAPTDAAPSTNKKEEALTPEAQAAGFTSMEDYKRFASDDWIPLD